MAGLMEKLTGLSPMGAGSGRISKADDVKNEARRLFEGVVGDKMKFSGLQDKYFHATMVDTAQKFTLLQKDDQNRLKPITELGSRVTELASIIEVVEFELPIPESYGAREQKVMEAVKIALDSGIEDIDLLPAYTSATLNEVGYTSKSKNYKCDIMTNNKLVADVWDALIPGFKWYEPTHIVSTPTKVEEIPTEGVTGEPEITE